MGIVQIDDNGNIVESNTAARQLLQPIEEAHQLSGDNIFSLLDQIAPGAGEQIRQAPAGPGLIFHNVTYRFELRTKEGHQERVYTITASRTDTDCIVVAFEDSTQKCHKEQELLQILTEKAVEQGKAELAADILHDIGNAVVGLGSYLTRIRRSLERNKDEMLQSLAVLFSAQQVQLGQAIGEEKAGAVVSMLSSLAANNKEMHEEMKSSANGQLAIISHIQEILNIQRQYVAGRETGERQPVNLRGIVTDCLSMLSATMEKRGIRLVSDLLEESALIKGNRTKLMQVIMNLLKNSIEAIDVKAAEKTISTCLHRKDGRLVLRISDTGCGYDDAIANRLFDRGFTTKSSGTGLGLYNCREIVESHNGSMQMTSDGPGKGAVITIQFNL
jgi:signal transduction histidine kinase